MQKRLLMLIVLSLPLFAVFAQNHETAAGPEPDGSSAEELTVEEFQTRSVELKGHVIKLTFDSVVNIEPNGSEGLTATVTYRNPQMTEWLTLTVPKAGMEFFSDIYEERSNDDEEVYIQILTPFTAKALGTRYRAERPEGMHYTW